MASGAVRMSSAGGQAGASLAWPPSRFCGQHQRAGRAPFGGRPVLSLAESQLAAQLAQQPAPGPRLSTPLEVGLAGGPLHRLRRRLGLGRGLGHTRGAAATSSDRGIFHLAEWRRIVLSGGRVTLAGCATSLLTFCDNVISVLLLFITTGGFKQMM